jgi:hypothetical protein
MYVSCGKENTTLCSSSTREFARKENEAAYIYIYIRAAVPCLGGREIRRPTSPTGNACMHARAANKRSQAYKLNVFDLSDQLHTWPKLM